MPDIEKTANTDSFEMIDCLYKDDCSDYDADCPNGCEDFKLDIYKKERKHVRSIKPINFRRFA